ncbi:FG-GAP-like repeat-containing protein [Streptomyces sp. NPDC020571]|uniref:FG-GAP-like repeat-containing protein n=1 Tax=Streptomyces sp. NPDC020571 TaxID=3365079 RepID=UPI0037AB2778
MALAATFLALPASTASASPRESDVAPSALTENEKFQKEVSQAKEKAKETGEPVEVQSGRTETDDVYVNPNGTLRVDQSLVPVRTWRSGSLVQIDTTLAVKNNRIEPKAVGLDLSLSNGGDKKLATLGSAGRTITLTWPHNLPTPTLDDNTATYPEVFPGVDLKITTGGASVSHSLIVKSAEAAENPNLKSISFGIDSKGLDLQASENGEVRAADAAGQTVFATPTPRMWDSAGAAAENDTKANLQTRAAGASTAPHDSADGSPEGSRQAELKVALDDTTLTLTPDQHLLTSPDTVFPVVIDPTWAKPAWKNAWSVAYKHSAWPSTANTVYYNGGTLSKSARVGYANDNQNGGTVRANTYFRIGTGNLAGKQILESTLRIKQTHAGSWSCKSGQLQIRSIGKTLPTNITWNNQPTWGGVVDSSGESFGGRNCPADSAGLVEFDVTSAVSSAARAKWANWAFVLTSKNTTIDTSWRLFDPDTARISTYYNTPPAKPTDRSINPSVPCTGGTIGLTDYITLRARMKDADDATLTTEFLYAPLNADEDVVRTKRSGARNTYASLRIDTKNLPTGTYWWDVRVSDGHANSPWAGRCEFTIDKDRPANLPGVTSQQFPENTDGSPARTEGTFVFTANGVKDVTRYAWWTEDDTTERYANAVTPGGPSPAVKYTPLAAGPQYLYVRSLDASGNRSSVRAYLFTPTRSATRDRAGDLNGDNNVDLWSVDPGSGALRMHPGLGNGKFGVSREAASGSFAGTTLAHRASWNEDYYEDLVTLQNGAEDPNRKELWVYANSGNGVLNEQDSGRYELTVLEESENHWHNADQILSVSSLNDDNNDGVITDADSPDLLVKTGDQLWLYLGSRGSPYLDDVSFQAILLGNADWQDMTLLAPGDLNGDSLPELWVRDTQSGNIHQYTSRLLTDADSPTTADLSVYGDTTARQTSIGTGFTGTRYPHLATNGDFENDGYADLWAHDGEGKVIEFPGRALTSGSAFAAARDLVMSGTPWAECESFPTSAGATTTHQLCGPVLAKYKALGGSSVFGYPSTDIVTAPDKVGRYAHFRSSDSTSNNRSIYWSPATGAWSVRGGIWAKWTAMAREGGSLGYPTSDERRTSDGVGFFSTFSKDGRAGAIYWISEYGGHSIQGGIYAQYRDMGATTVMGYPTTDELTLPIRSGRYQHFRRRGEAADTGSIYWTSATGAWPVTNAIRTKWLALNGAEGWLGLPRTTEEEVTGGVSTTFDNGYIRWNRHSRTALEHKPDDRTAHLRTDLMGDVDGDGRSDLITAYDYQEGTTSLHTFTADEQGRFAPPTQAWVSGKGNFHYEHARFATGDFNGDGRDDVAALYGYSDGTTIAMTFISEGDGTFKHWVKSAELPSGWDWNRTKLVAGDFNGDKRSDLAVVYDYSDGVTGTHTLLAKEDGTFNAPVASWKSGTGNWYSSNVTYSAGDANGDGRDDIIAYYAYSSGEVALFTLPATASGGFTTPVKSWNAAAGTWDKADIKFTTGDYNGDGRHDAAFIYDYGDGVTGAHTFTANTDGGFTPPVASWKSGTGNWYSTSTGAVVSGDTNNDGHADIATMYNYAIGASRAYTLLSQPDGTFPGPRGSWYADPGTW